MTTILSVLFMGLMRPAFAAYGTQYLVVGTVELRDGTLIQGATYAFYDFEPNVYSWKTATRSTSSMALDPNRAFQVIDLSDALPGTVMERIGSDLGTGPGLPWIRPFGETCRATSHWEQIPWDSVLRVRLELRSSSEVLARAHQVSFLDHYNDCVGSKLEIGENPYFRCGGEDGAVAWYYPRSAEVESPPGLELVELTNDTNICGTTIAAFATAGADLQSLRVAAHLLCTVGPVAPTSTVQSWLASLPPPVTPKLYDELATLEAATRGSSALRTHLVRELGLVCSFNERMPEREWLTSDELENERRSSHPDHEAALQQ